MSAEARPADAVQAAVALGSNVGDRERHLATALAGLAALPGSRLLARSSWHATRPVGGPPGQGDYLNGAALLSTTLPPQALLDGLLALEHAAGRRRVAGERDAPRTLDLDLLTYGARVIDLPGLCVPHPRLEERAFVLEPLAEIAPALRLARSGRTVAEALRALRQTSGRSA